MRDNTNTLVTWGYVLSILSLFCCCCPYALAIPGLILGIVAYSRGDRRGLWIIIISVTSLVLGGVLNLTGYTNDMRMRLPERYRGPWMTT